MGFLDKFKKTKEKSTDSENRAAEQEEMGTLSVISHQESKTDIQHITASSKKIDLLMNNVISTFGGEIDIIEMAKNIGIDVKSPETKPCTCDTDQSVKYHDCQKDSEGENYDESKD